MIYRISNLVKHDIPGEGGGGVGRELKSAQKVGTVDPNRPQQPWDFFP